jgi:hypothetical protein
MDSKRSLNEIEHTCRKAARGCGLPWGVADEVGKAVRWLHVFNLDGTRILAMLLERVDHHEPVKLAPRELDGTWSAVDAMLSPLLVGPTLCDCLGMMANREIETGSIAWPLLTAGFLGQAALESTQSVRMCWQGVVLDLHRDFLWIEGNNDDLYCASAQSLTCVGWPVQGDKESVTMTIGDAEVDPGAWQRLEQFAHQTYVEASEESRLSGAGAGMNDND